MTLVTIIIPVFNKEKYILDCISSVMNQTYREFEALVIDDCGTDKSIDIVTSYLKEYDIERKFRIIRHFQNGGLSAARNTGIDHAKGKYIYFLDGDDYLPKNSLKNLVQLLQKYPNSEIVYGDFNQIPYRWMNCIPSLTNSSLKEHYESKDKIKSLILDRMALPELVPNKLFSLEFIKQHKLYFKEKIIHEDTLYIYYLSKYVTEIAICKMDTYNYRKNEGGIMLATDKEKRASNIDLIALDCSRHMDFTCIFPQVKFILHLVHSSLFLRNRISVTTPVLIKGIKMFGHWLSLILKR